MSTTPSNTPEETEANENPSQQSTTEWLLEMMKKKVCVSDSGESSQQKQKLTSLTPDGIVKYIKEKKCSNIVTMAGAGISTSSGIPDFRSPTTGLYNNLQKYDLPHPQAIFELNYFKENPKPFFELAKELWPGEFYPTPCHYFIKLLQDKNLLMLHLTQNIDTLERLAGISEDKLIEAHGTFHTSHCLTCSKEYSKEFIKEIIFKDEIPRCTEADCSGLIKPDIVFFGEALPSKFFKTVKEDLQKCDLLIIMGTSLTVQPFASLVNRVCESTPRLYINMESGESCDPLMALLGMGTGFQFDSKDNYRDVFWKGDCDSICFEFAEKLGWKSDLDKLIENGKELSKKNENTESSDDIKDLTEKMSSL